MNITDLRSDTVTKPTPGMLQAMFAAQVGDDVYEEDPTINALEQKAAAMFGMEAGLFCPSGTMTNQIAIKAHTEPMTEVICDVTAHIYQYEGGGIMFNSGASVALVHGERGKMTPAQVEAHIRPDNIHYPPTRLVALENTCNKGGGAFYTLEEIAAISEVCKRQGIALHLDGARVFNALVASGEDAVAYGNYFDSISICLSKGLGAPVGSLLLGKKEFVKKSRRIRKVLGGGIRQGGYLAAAGIYALENNIERLAEDHRKAKEIESMLIQADYVEYVLPVQTNIVIFKLNDRYKDVDFVAALAENSIRASSFGPQMVRFVTHLDVSDDMLQHVLQVLHKLNKTHVAI
ncbi:aminotransferase class I/II-fold pyridoxal phosphate-dependent enzyme [Pontibacter sp. JH31]|uniref:Aminotransferase class I/II-fold pyridoxal phosphate-dependent enzyme n=1 Tax=Pontibacter aquaedesilientis TaxID=2766980 RepID=A0ABR7XDG1_9BACT|nr:GntG family PLP-dependent aldolase [Pontibacter aquaedesilientis]MBD1396332.1 aminotransferase class I/II-fold pyridoxal phosphate-dependent enzyme [Pontibacter aquaedesilientis]